MIKQLLHCIIFLGTANTLFSSCQAYKQDIMLRTDTVDPEILRREMLSAEKNYTIQANDFLELEVYTNQGERIIDPDFELLKELNSGGGQAQNNRVKPRYLVQENGLVKLPMIGDIYLLGYTLYQADSVLANAYNEFYKGSFVITRFVNKRVVVLGATGGQVIPIENENMNLLEVIALSGGIAGQGKAYNIRLIRGDLDHPQVQLIDLSTIEGMQKASLRVESGDIVYIEPIRRVLPETIRDITPVVGLVANALTLLIVIINLN